MGQVGAPVERLDIAKAVRDEPEAAGQPLMTKVIADLDDSLGTVSETSFQIRPVGSAVDLDAAARLFEAYASSVGVDLGYQDFSTELATLPGKYATPAGELLLARDSHGKPLGCVGLRPIKPGGCCEMKRLYVSPEARGLGLGRALVDAIIAAAVRIGYGEMRLDTLPTMAEAISLYTKAGFARIEPYYETPIAGTLFFARALAANSD